ncbi:MAG TPA: FtsX-like permease family protein [Candidatus Binatia bacterium]|nr:FtsX-like permease family protein [Candidatus Binatia bacterium]
MSRLPFELFLALRYLRPKRTFVSIITLISVIGVMLGVAVLIIVISVMSGFDKETRDRLLGFTAHMRVTRGGRISNYEEVMRIVGSNVNVKGVAPYVFGQVLMETQPAFGNQLVAAPMVRGIEPQYETRVSNLSTNIVGGSMDLEGSGLLVGSGLAHDLNLEIGDRVAVYSPSYLNEIRRRLEERKKNRDIDELPLPDDYAVRGIFDVGYNEYNANVIVTSLENAQVLYGLGSSVHGVFILLHDPFKVEEVARQLRASLGQGYEFKLWTDEHSVLLNAILVEKNVMFYLLFFITIVAAFGIMNSLITFVVQKTREIGLLKALGATRVQILSLFLGEGFIVGIIGVLSGFGLGMLGVHYRNEFLDFLRRTTKFELFPAQIYNFTQLPALIDLSDITIICGSALLICLIAGLVPAWTASRLQPVEALRHE